MEEDNINYEDVEDFESESEIEEELELFRKDLKGSQPSAE